MYNTLIIYLCISEVIRVTIILIIGNCFTLAIFALA